MYAGKEEKSADCFQTKCESFPLRLELEMKGVMGYKKQDAGEKDIDP